MRSLRLAASLALLAAVATSQTTHFVGPGGFALIDDAITAAAPGDTILVTSATYVGFYANKGVTIRGLGAGATVFFLATVSPPAGQTVHLVNLDMGILSITGGNVTMDTCRATNCTVASANLTMQACTISFGGSGNGLVVNSSYVSAIDSTFFGQNQGMDLVPTEAVRLFNSTFHASFVTLSATNGWLPALTATNSTVWISDSTMLGGTMGAVPCAVNASQGQLTRCTISPPCTPTVPTTGLLLGMHRSNPFTSPGPFQLEFHTEPNSLVAVWASTSLGNLMVPRIPQALLLDAPSLFLCEVLVANASGIANNTWNLPAGLTNQTFWFQGLGIGTTLQLGPIAGGVVL